MNKNSTENRILLVDDDEQLCQLLVSYLNGEGMHVDYVCSGEEAVDALIQGESIYQAVVLDIMMPGMSGLDVLQHVRRKSDIAVIMLTGRGDDIDRIVGLEMGADDYLGKPCNPRELLARLRAIMRRTSSGGDNAHTKPLSRFGIHLNPETMDVRIDNEPVELTGAEFRVLQVLLTNAGTTVSKEQMTEQVLNRKLTAHDRSIDVHISRVRQKLNKHTDNKVQIRTVRGVGYLMSELS